MYWFKITAKLRKISGVLIVYWPITIKFRMRKQTSKPQTNYRCCLQFSYHAPYWLIPHNTITFHKYLWCSWFCEFHSKLQNIIRNKTQFQYKVKGGLHLGGLKLGVFFCLQVDGLMTGGCSAYKRRILYPRGLITGGS